MTGQHLADLACTREGQRYVLGTRVPKDDATWSGPWDCAELASWAAYQVAGVLIGVVDPAVHPSRADAYSGAWARDATRAGVGVSVPVGQWTPGAVLVRAPSAPGLSGHVAVSLGGGLTIEAYDGAHGVIRSRSTGRPWTHAALVPGLTYELGAPPPLAPVLVLRTGSRGDAVRLVQAAVGVAQDGIYGPVTAAAVEAFQRGAHLVADGEVGPITARALGLQTWP